MDAAAAGQSEAWALVPAAILLATVIAAVIAHFRPLWPFARPRQGVGPVLLVGVIGFGVALNLVGDKLPAPPPQTETETAQSSWSSVRDAVARRAMGFQPRRAGMRDSAEFRNVRVYWHDAPLTDPRNPRSTLGPTVVCGEVAVITSIGEARDGDFRPFVASGGYANIVGDYGREPPPWSYCTGRLVLVVQDGDRVMGRAY